MVSCLAPWPDGWQEAAQRRGFSDPSLLPCVARSGPDRSRRSHRLTAPPGRGSASRSAMAQYSTSSSNSAAVGAREPGGGTPRRNAPWHYAALRCAQFPPRTKLRRMSQTTEHRPRSRSMKDSQPAPPSRPITSYPPGALVRSSDICRDPKRGYAGILPIDRSTWHRWVKSGKAPAGRCLAGTSTRVWEIEAVRSLGTSTP